MLVGKTTSFGEGTVDIFVVRTDASGQEIWRVAFGGNKRDVGAAIARTRDGAFVIVGTSSESTTPSHVVFLKIDENGSQIWEHIYGGEGRTRGSDVVETPDGGFFLLTSESRAPDLAGAKNVPSFDHALGIVWTDSDGRIRRRWTHREDAGNAASPYEFIPASLRLLSDGDVLVGATMRYLKKREGAYAARFDFSGRAIWSTAMPGLRPIRGNDIHLAPDGGFLMVGATPDAHNDDRLYLLKIAGVQRSRAR